MLFLFFSNFDLAHLLDADFLALQDFNLSIKLADLGLHGGLLLDNLLLVPGQSLDLLLELHHGGLVLGAEGVDLLLGLVVDVLQQLPQLGHLGLALPVDLELGLGSRLGLSQPLGQGDDLHLKLLLLVLYSPSQSHLRFQIFLQNTDLLLVSPHGSWKIDIERKVLRKKSGVPLNKITKQQNLPMVNLNYHTDYISVRKLDEIA